MYLNLNNFSNKIFVPNDKILNASNSHANATNDDYDTEF